MIVPEESFFESAQKIACPLCANIADAAICTSGRPFNHCVTCDLIFVPNQWHFNENAQRNRYAKHDNTSSNTGYVKMLDQFVQRIKGQVPPGCRVIDIGCGPNQVLVNLLCAAGYQAVGHDPLYGINGIRNAPFEAVVSTETIEHFSNPHFEFAQMTRILSGGSVIALTTRFHRGAPCIADWWYARDPTHVSFYSQTTMSWIARHYGFQIIDIDDRGFCSMRKSGSAHSSS